MLTKMDKAISRHPSSFILAGCLPKLMLCYKPFSTDC